MEETEKIGANRQPDGTFGPGNVANPDGRPPETPEQKILRKATKEIVKEYKENLAQALPKIEPVLIDKAVNGDIQAIKEIHDRVMDKSRQPTDIQGEISVKKFTISRGVPGDEITLSTTQDTITGS